MSFTWRPKATMFAAATIASLVSPSPALPQDSMSDTPNVHPRGCVYFQQSGFAGDRALILEHEDRDLLGERWDNQISSVQCASSCQLLAYDRSFYEGERHDFSGTVANLDADWDDKISSMVVICRRRTADIRIHPVR